MRDVLTTLALTPILIPQALWVVMRASRLPEAAGPRGGTIGQGRPLRVLITGDSSAAGVGAQDQSQALGGQIAALLGTDFEVSWQVIAKSGGTTASTCAMLQDSPPEACDIAVVALGVNDTKNGVSAQAWQRNYRKLVTQLQDEAGAQRVYVSGLPPMHQFPLLPAPLSSVLGARAKRFDQMLRAMAECHTSLRHVSMDMTFAAEGMAADGFHPGPVAYTEWARLFADHIRQDHAAGKITTL